MTAIDAAIFDLDGLLIDTEPIWRRAQVEVWGRLGQAITEEECLAFMGMPIKRIAEERYRQYPWEGSTTIDQVGEQVIDSVIDHVRSEGEALAGVYHALRVIHEAGLRIGIASSSPERLIYAVVDRLGIAEYIQTVTSAEHEAHGKPHPDVYITAARALGTPPERCIALEDSPNGVLAAKAAGMFCIVVPDRHMAGDERMNRADLRLDTLADLTPGLLKEIIGARVRL